MSDTLPLGVRVEWVAPVVDTRFADWLPLGRGLLPQLRVFRRATFEQSDEVFRYVYDRVGVAPIPDSLFRPSVG
jgi:hypothetical protein